MLWATKFLLTLKIKKRHKVLMRDNKIFWNEISIYCEQISELALDHGVKR